MAVPKIKNKTRVSIGLKYGLRPGEGSRVPRPGAAHPADLEAGDASNEERDEPHRHHEHDPRAANSYRRARAINEPTASTASTSSYSAP